MAKSIFSSDISSKLEQEGNLYQTCRGLSTFVRTLNTRKQAEEAVPDEASTLTTALYEYAEGRIDITRAA